MLNPIFLVSYNCNVSVFPPAARQSGAGLSEVVGELRASTEAEREHDMEHDIVVRAPRPLQERPASVPHQDEHSDESVEQCRQCRRPLDGRVARDEVSPHVERLHPAGQHDVDDTGLREYDERHNVRSERH